MCLLGHIYAVLGLILVTKRHLCTCVKIKKIYIIVDFSHGVQNSHLFLHLDFMFFDFHMLLCEVP